MNAPTLSEPPPLVARPDAAHSAGRRGPIALAAVVVLVVALVGAWLATPGLAKLSSDTELHVRGAQWVSLPRFEGGMEVVRYVHGEVATIDLPVRNDSPFTVEVTGIALTGENKPMLQVLKDDRLSLELGPGESATASIRARFANCKYYTERAMMLLPSVSVSFESFGRAGVQEVELARQLAVRSPTIVDCPDRTMDRSYNRRNGG